MIEKIFGSTLSWERLDNKRASRISKKINHGTLRDKESWPKLQEQMIDAMIKFESALKPFIKNLE